jgi:hypothetical protein
VYFIESLQIPTTADTRRVHWVDVAHQLSRRVFVLKGHEQFEHWQERMEQHAHQHLAEQQQHSPHRQSAAGSPSHSASFRLPQPPPAHGPMRIPHRNETLALIRAQVHRSFPKLRPKDQSAEQQPLPMAGYMIRLILAQRRIRCFVARQRLRRSQGATAVVTRAATAAAAAIRLASLGPAIAIPSSALPAAAAAHQQQPPLHSEEPRLAQLISVHHHHAQASQQQPHESHSLELAAPAPVSAHAPVHVAELPVQQSRQLQADSGGGVLLEQAEPLVAAALPLLAQPVADSSVLD